MKGILIGGDTLRVYDSKGNFTDYFIAHSDLEIEIIDKDYQIKNNTIDHSDKTLGLN